jgi:solute carrier family 8 (sodium/calcium exchanger)
MFPLLVILAFIADKGLLFKLCRSRKHTEQEMKWYEDEGKRIKEKYGKDLPKEALTMMLKQRLEREKPQNTSKAAMRSGRNGGAVNAADGNNACTFGFVELNYVVLECHGNLEIKVAASRPCPVPMQMHYRTVEGTALAGKRFKHCEGVLHFAPNQRERFIHVRILDDNEWQADEDFAVELSEFGPSAGASPRTTGASPRSIRCSQREPELGRRRTVITVVNDDMPGTLGFDSDETFATEGAIVNLGVVRTRGSCGRITVNYKTVQSSAVAGKDYAHTEGTLTFEDGETHKTCQVQILKSPDHAYEGNESFKVVLYTECPGVKFNENTDGGADSAVCDVVILSMEKASCAKRWWRSCCNRDMHNQWFLAWRDQFMEAFWCNGSPEEQAVASAQDWVMHTLTLTWKVIFCAFVPPPCFVGGWLCFGFALLMIGVVTAIVGDMAGSLGCCVGIPNDITAITLVALGTSLPDTFASKLAAQQDDTADNSVGNVTGSNSVNVFLGLGLPWMFAAFYWKGEGPTLEWQAHIYKGAIYKERFMKTYPDGGFLVPAGSLSFSVSVFSACAIACIILLFVRRKIYGGELGGPKCAQRRDSLILTALWLIFITLSCIESISNK